MYLFHLVAHLLRSLYSETRASTIVPDVRFVNATLQSEISGTPRVPFHVAQQINTGVKMTHVHRQLILSSQIYLCYMPTAVPRDLARARIILDGGTVNESLDLLVGYLGKISTPCPRPEGKLSPAVTFPPVARSHIGRRTASGKFG